MQVGTRIPQRGGVATATVTQALRYALDWPERQRRLRRGAGGGCEQSYVPECGETGVAAKTAVRPKAVARPNEGMRRRGVAW